MPYVHFAPVGDGAKLYRESYSIMATNSFHSSTINQPGALLPSQSDPYQHLWYVAYTSANHEKKVAQEINRRGVETFLPLYQSVRRWSDRRVTIEKPLFPGYVFVRLARQNRLCVLQVPGICKFVGFGGPPVALPDDQLNILRAGVEQLLRAEPHPYLSVGRRVRVRSGPFTGLEGILRRRKNRTRLIVSLDLIQRSMSVELEDSTVDPL
jgi:transcription antitermination factor NusG